MPKIFSMIFRMVMRRRCGRQCGVFKSEILFGPLHNGLFDMFRRSSQDSVPSFSAMMGSALTRSSNFSKYIGRCSSPQGRSPLLLWCEVHPVKGFQTPLDMVVARPRLLPDTTGLRHFQHLVVIVLFLEIFAVGEKIKKLESCFWYLSCSRFLNARRCSSSMRFLKNRRSWCPGP